VTSATTGQVKLGAYEGASLLLMRTLTPLHIGVGRVVGVVDLPIIRDALGFPLIPTSSLKGALRSQLSEALADDVLKVLFGPEPEEKAYAGALALTEGYLLAMPARSLRAIWAFVTSPVLIRRFLRMIQMMKCLEPSRELEGLKKLADGLLREGEKMKADKALVCKEGEEKLSIEIMGKRSIIINEEFQLECEQSEAVRAFFEAAKAPEVWRAVLLHDDRIRDVVERSILRRARVRLRQEKVVEEGPWSEEDVPADALFFNILLYSKPRKSHEGLKDVKDVRGRVLEALFRLRGGYVIFGGHETIGRGVVELIGLAGCPS
jgi:CRISPR-associated protein Cmr4